MSLYTDTTPTTATSVAVGKDNSTKVGTTCQSSCAEMQLRKRLAKRGLLQKQAKNGPSPSLPLMKTLSVSPLTTLHDFPSSSFSSPTTSIASSPEVINPTASPVHAGVSTTASRFSVPRSTWVVSSKADHQSVFKATLIRYGVDSVY